MSGVGHLVFGLGELVAATLVMFVGHWLLLKVDSTRIMPVGRNGGQFPIYSTTPTGTSPVTEYNFPSAMEIFIKYLGIVQGTAEALRFPTPLLLRRARCS